MKIYILKAVCIAVFLNIAFAVNSKDTESTSSKVVAQGKTFLKATAGKSVVQVEIDTHEVQIGKPSDPWPEIIKTNCTYSRYPCSIVDWIGISVDGNRIVDPRSAFADLADLNEAQLQKTKTGWALVLGGGDASESYIVKIYFDSNNVVRRTAASGMEPQYILQETTYHQLVIGD